MWRAFFLAIGVFLVILGVECLGVERVSLKIHDKPAAPVSPFDTETTEGRREADRSRRPGPPGACSPQAP